MRVITFSRFFPATHPRKGDPTLFIEQIYNSIGMKIGVTKESGDMPKEMHGLTNDFVLLDGQSKKHHTIRAGNRWKAGDKFSPRVWSGKPYRSKQIEFAPAIEIKEIFEIEIRFPDDDCPQIFIDTCDYGAFLKDYTFVQTLAMNDGLSPEDLINWFNKPFVGQIICWNENIEY